MSTLDKCRHCGGWSTNMILHEHNCVLAPNEPHLGKKYRKVPCEYCDDDGRVELDNNGPIVTCPICKGTKVRLVED